MIEHVRGVDSNLQTFRFGDTERFAQVRIETPCARILESISADGATFSRQRILQQNLLRCGIRDRLQRTELLESRSDGEALRVREDRKGQGVDLDDLPSVVGLGASVNARWRFAAGRELTARYEVLGFDDVGAETNMDSVRPRASDLRARAAQAVTVGASWRLRQWVRLMGNAGTEWFSDPRTAPEPGRDSGYWTLGLRLQVELPGNFRWRVQ